MFGRKAKLRKQQELKNQNRAELAKQQEAQQPDSQLSQLEPIDDVPLAVAEERIFCESEELEEKDATAETAIVIKAAEPVLNTTEEAESEEAATAESVVDDTHVEESETQEETIAEGQENNDENVAPVEELAKAEPEENAEQAEQTQEDAPIEQVEKQPDGSEVVYSVDRVDEEAEAKPAKLIKLPNLMDYIINANVSTKVKIQVAVMLVGAYNKFKDIPEEKKILKDCMKKIIRSLQQELQK